MKNHNMKSFIAYLLAFTMLLSVTSQAVLPAVAAADNSVVTSVVLPEEQTTSDNGSASLPLLDAASSQQASSTQEDSNASIASSESAEDKTSENTVSSSEEQQTSETSQSQAASDASSVASASGSQASSVASSSEATEDSSAVSSEVAGEEQEDNNQTEESKPEVSNGTAAVNVNVRAAMTIEQDVLFTAVLSQNGEEIARNSGSLAANQEGDASSVTIKLADLTSGSYQLTVSAQGFATYTQGIEVKNGVYSTVTLYTGELNGYNADQAHPGFLRVGDANNDGKLNGEDADAVVNAMENGTVDLADFNRDGVVNLIDMQYLATNLDENESQVADVRSTVETRIADNLAKPVVNENTKVEGEIEALVNDGGSVTLAPANDAPISKENAVAVDFNFAATEDVAEEDLPVMEGLTIQSPAESENTITEGTITVTYIEDGVEKTVEAQIQDESKARTFSLISLFSSTPTVVRKSDGSLEVNFGKQIAVKKVTLTITATQSNNLAEISKVEFLNGMENRIPEPEMDIPTELTGIAGDKEFTLTWKQCLNVTAYEVEISGPTKDGNKTVVVRSTNNQLVVSNLGGSKMINNRDYTVRVQSVNGEWKSGYSDSITVRPMATKLPAAPDNVEAVGAYRAISVSWKDMDDTDSYTVLYRKVTEEGKGEYVQAVTGLTKNSYRIENLEDNVKYEIVVYGTNDLGDGEYSIPSVATTQSILPAWMPSYKLINTANEAGALTNHIASASYVGNGYMVNSPLDSDTTALGVFDNTQESYFYTGDWDFGAIYHNGHWGIAVEFDAVQAIGAFAFAEPENGSISSASFWYKNEETGQMQALSGIRVSVRQDSNKRRYIYVSLPKEVNTSKVLIGFTNNYAIWGMKVAEMRFYGYDSIYDNIMALYADDYHTTLRPEVDQDTLDALNTRLNTPDSASNEKHPNHDQLQRELDTAIKIYQNSANLTEVQHIKAIGATVNGHNDNSLGFAGLNPWQPLGITAAAGEEITIYVGNPLLQAGDNTDLYLVATQYNAESGNFVKELTRLKVGENTIVIPDIVSKDFEHGGSLYIRYGAKNDVSKYGVRVVGGTRIPTLDLYGLDDTTNHEERMQRVTTYVEQLESYVANLENLHNELHQNSSNASVHYDYNKEECILGATELMGDYMLLSLSAEQVLAGLGSGTVAEKAERLNQSMLAMDEMMILFYQHKGLIANAPDVVNRTPSQHLNIRYHRMFAGAFMYAAGNHIGVGWGSVPGVVQGSPVVSDELGNYISGNYFGWGIAHEIGHDINQGSYAVAEVTNNYFSQLATYENGSVRFGYNAVYDKVTSGTVGASSDVFTQLVMYWQLRLAYDNYYPYKTFDNYKDLFNSLFYARVDSYARTPSSAPKAAENGVALTLNGDSQQNFMRLASAAAQKNLTDFFTRWGMVPNAETAAYMAQFPEETRAIYYIKDSAQDYRIKNPNGANFIGKDVLSSDEVTVTKGNDMNGLAQNQVKVDIKPASTSSELLGYEINRTIISGGKEERQTVGFVLASEDGSATFTDTITTINNRVFTYDVVAIDQYQNRANTLVLEPMKISHDGSQDKTDWTVTTNMTSEQDVEVIPDEENPDNGYNPGANNSATIKSAISMAFDNSMETTFEGVVANGTPTISMQFNKALDVTGFKFTLNEGKEVPAGTFTVELCENGEWVTVPTNVTEITETGSTIVYFVTEDGWMRTSSATAMRITFTGATSVNVTELDVLGPTGDNVEMVAEDSIGILESDYVYDSEGGKIPAGSIVFIGSYKGNPAYNVVILYDQDGKIVGYGENGEGSSEQIILAEVPDQGDLANTSDGRWVYWISPEAVLPEKVRVELYRVDNAQTNQGQRMVSDSLWVTVPSELPSITINSDSQS